VFCFLALIIFSVLGIFSASHRQLAKEAAKCVFRRLRLKPCEASFDAKVKAKLISKLILKSPKTARFINRYFDIISLAFFIMLILSGFWVSRSLYNYYMYGNCNGPESSGFCLFDPTGQNAKVSGVSENAGESCDVNPPSIKGLTMKPLDLSAYPTLNSQAEKEIVFIGCYACPYTRKAYPAVKKLVEKYKPRFVFVHFPVKEKTDFLSYYTECVRQQDEQKFWRLNDWLFAADVERISDGQQVVNQIESLGVDMKKFRECVMSDKTAEKVSRQKDKVKETGLYGTPTVFINGKPVVGPKPYRVYKRMLRSTKKN